MRKADIEIETVITVILIVVGLLILVLLIAGLATNTESIGGFIEDLLGGFF